LNKEKVFRAGFGLKTKFLIWLVIFTLGVMIVVYTYFSYHETRTLSYEIKLRGEAICNNVVASAEDLLVLGDDLGLAKLVYDTKEKNEGIIYCFIVDEKNKIWAHTDVSLVNQTYDMPSGFEELKNQSILLQSLKMPGGIEVFEIAMPIKVKQKKIGEAHVAVSLAAIRNAVTEARKGITLVTVVILLIGIIGILVLVSFIIGSLGAVTKDIEAIGNGDLERKIVTRRRDEVGRITHAVKIMVKKLKKARAELIEKERMKKEMQIAQEIQHSLLPRSLQQFPGFKIEAYYQSAREVGGDYYDLIEIDNDHFAVVIGDVSGKSVAGSLVMAMVRSIIKIETFKNPSPQGLLTLVHSSLSKDTPEDMFMTLFYVVFSIKDNDIIYCCAGHNPAYLFSPQEQKLQVLKTDGFPLGMSLIDKKEFAQQLKEGKYKFNRGEVLILYTDGITEAMNARKELFGEDRLENLINENGGKTPAELKEIIRNAVETFTGREPQSDDITFVIIQRE
jgi:serine phosphatase RsbU (regulator of sigma subunit)